jgi:putative transposase
MPTAKRGAVENMVLDHRLSRARACRIVVLSRSALNRSTVDLAAKDAPVVDAINEIVTQRTRWGFWKYSGRLRADGHGWNHKRVHRLQCAMRRNLKRKARNRIVTRERRPRLVSPELNRIWVFDFLRDTMYSGRPLRTHNFIDERVREVLRIEVGTSIPATRVVRVLDQLLDMYGRSEAIRLDNGPELTAQDFVDWSENHKVMLLYIQPGKPNQNAVIECFSRSSRVEVAQRQPLRFRQRGPEGGRQLDGRIQKLSAP